MSRHIEPMTETSPEDHAERLKQMEDAALWRALTAITDGREGASVTVYNRSLQGWFAFGVTLGRHVQRVVSGTDRLELLRQAKSIVEEAERA